MNASKLCRSRYTVYILLLLFVLLHGCAESGSMTLSHPDDDAWSLDSGRADSEHPDDEDPTVDTPDAEQPGDFDTYDPGVPDVSTPDTSLPHNPVDAGDQDPDISEPDASQPDVKDPGYPDIGEPDVVEEPYDPIDWFTPHPPVTKTPHDQWKYVPVEGAVCANGDQSGFFINFSHTSSDVLIFLLGGGICYDDPSCLLHVGLVNNGMGGDPYNWWMQQGARHTGVFQRHNPENPFKDASYVVLPHCTVDFHAANKESTYASTGTIQQRGYRNVQLAMNHVVPTFANPDRNVTIAGFSAGGVGTLANYHQIASAFESYGHQPPFMINDSGPIQTRPFFSLNSHNALRGGWNLSDTIDPWCETCADQGYHETLYWIHQLHPGVRTSLITAYGDMVVMGLYGLFDVGNVGHFQIDIIPTPPFSYTYMRPGLDAFRAWSEGFPTAGMHRNLLYHWGDRHGALMVAPISEAHTPAIVPFLNAQLNRNDPYWFSPHY